MSFANWTIMEWKDSEAASAMLQQMRNSGPTVITTADRRRLGSLLTGDDACMEPRAASDLDALLEDAVYVEPAEAPDDIVTLDTTVELVDGASGESRFVTLSSPDAAELFDDSVSVVKPLGMALLGSSVGDVLEWYDGGDEVQIRRIIYQPEQALAGSRPSSHDF
ncbi:MAG TPA: GreA/GreB family elongation factor [Lacipirellula sp.]